MNTKINLQLFAAGTNVNGTEGTINAQTGTFAPYENGSGLSAEMRTFYSDYLIDHAEAKLVHDQFGQRHPIPTNGGKAIQFRKYDPLPKLTGPISEGITPVGQSINMGVVEQNVAQYGGYVELSDMLLMTAIDNNLVMATKLIGSQAGRTLDTITREVLAGGSNIQYGQNSVSARYLLTGGAAAGNHYLTVDCIRRAVRSLKNANAERISGSYIAIIHPDCAYDLMNDEKWQYPHQYVDTDNIYEGEIGRIEGCRFVETTEAKIFHAADLMDEDTAGASPAARTLVVSSYASATKRITVKEKMTQPQTDALAGRYILVGSELAQVVSATPGAAGAAYLTLKDALVGTPAANDVVFPGEGGADGRDVYATVIIGDNAYGVTEVTGGGLEHIVKQLGSAGTSDPLNQRATVGWKATKAAVRLVEAFMIRVETASTFESGKN